MKKILLFASALAGLFLAGSCQRENLEPMESANTVTYTVQVPGALSTKTIGENVAAVTELVYEVYRTEATSADDFTQAETLLFHKTATITKGTATVEFELVNDQNFRVLFWAQVPGNDVYNVGSLKNVKISQALNANAENYAAFAGADYIKAGENIVGRTLPLVRPIAQLNIGTDDASLWIENQTKALISTSAVKVNGLSTSYNVAEDKAGEISDADYVYAAKPVVQTTEYPGLSESTFAVNGTNYNYVAMNYVGFAPQMGTNVEVTYTINTENVGTITNTIDNVPVKANHRTNIVGNLITSMSDYTITLDKEWQDLAGGNMEVIIEGIVKNINGDYEISTAVGFAYAINELFADGGTFYIHPGTYDFTGLVVVPQPTKPGAILNVKANEVPVVTRSTSGFEIIGLDVAYLVLEVSNGSQAIFSNLVLPEDTKLVGENNGVVGIANCSNAEQETGEALIDDNTNGKVVNTVSMATVAEIKAAMEQGLKLIELTGDVTTSDQFAIGTSVIIDGKGHTWTYTGNGANARAITVEKNEDNIDLTVKNLTVNCTSSYCQRGVNFNTTGSLTLNNVIVSGENITYAVNFPGSSDESNVTITDSYLRGNIALNVWGEKMTINATNTEFVSYDANPVENYAAISLNNDGSSIANETTVNITDGKIIALDENGEPSNAVRNSTMSGEVVVSETTEVVGVVINPVAAVVYEGYNEFYSFTTLQKAIDKVCEDNNGSVRLIKDITVSETVVVPADETVVIDLNGKTLEGTMPKSVGHVLKNEGTLTLKNGTISSIGANGGSAIYNAGTLTVLNATINGASVRENEGWPSYPVNNYSDATLENVTVTGYQGAIAANAPGTTTVTNCTINKEYLNTSSHVFYISHADAMVIVNGGTYTHKGMDGSLAYVSGKITINGGVFSASNGGYGMAALTGGSIEVNGGDFKTAFFGWGGEIKIYGGTFASKPADTQLAEGYQAVQTAAGNYTVIPNAVEFAADDAAVQEALAKDEKSTTIYLDAKEYTIEMYTNFAEKESLTIIGTEGTKVKFANQQVRLQLAKNFTIKNCEILHMATKSWGMLVFGGRDSGAVNCTVSNCSFKGVGTQGIYINENISGAVYNIENCTFDGDFGSADGAVTIQNNHGVKFTVNVTGCTFNTDSNEICYLYNDPAFTLNTDPTVTPVCLNR